MLATISDEMLVAELYRLGVKHLARLEIVEPPNITPIDLIKGLAMSEDARVQASLILLFLRQPAFSKYTDEAIKQLSEESADTVKLYYQAAFYLQAEIEPVISEILPAWQRLPDLFSDYLKLPAYTSIDEALRNLGEMHRGLSGWAYNWSGSYRQNIARFIKQLRRDYGHHPTRSDS
ncbi:MAG: hypothetical protein HZC38_07230 [Chloroflexi bacterium]|nr:hypothetical protein [Chloroflexota bacterium]